MGFSLGRALTAAATFGFSEIGRALTPDIKVPPFPELPEIPRPPSIDDAAKRQEQTRLRRRRGRASQILTGPQGAGTPITATKVLLGG